MQDKVYNKPIQNIETKAPIPPMINFPKQTESFLCVFLFSNNNFLSAQQTIWLSPYLRALL